MNFDEHNPNKRSLTELTSLIASGIYTDEDFKEFQSLAEANRNAKEERKTKLAEIRALIEAIDSSESRITPEEAIALFPQELLAAVVQTMHAKTRNKPSSVKTAKERVSDKEIELFFVPKEGKPGDKSFSLRKGRIFERYNSSNSSPFLLDKANFPKKLLAIGTSESELMKFVSATDMTKASEYLKTDAGKAEIAMILSVVTKAKEKLNKVT